MCVHHKISVTVVCLYLRINSTVIIFPYYYLFLLRSFFLSFRFLVFRRFVFLVFCYDVIDCLFFWFLFFLGLCVVL